MWLKDDTGVGYWTLGHWPSRIWLWCGETFLEHFNRLIGLVGQFWAGGPLMPGEMLISCGAK